MEINDFNCSRCDLMYNTNHKTPRILTKCGHTFCQNCLKEIIFNNKIKCPEDNQISENINKIEDLPKNVTLISLLLKLTKRKMTTPNKIELKEWRDSLNIMTEGRKSSLLNSKNSRNSINNTTFQFSRSNRESLAISTNNKNLGNLTIVDNSDSTFISEFKLVDQPNPNLNKTFTYEISNSNFCHKHKRPLEIICLDHKIKICTTCALFEDHKHHNLKSEEDLLKEVTLKAEILIEYYEIIEKNRERLEQQQNKNETFLVQDKIKIKSEKMKEKVSLFFKELRFLLKTKEKQMIEEIDEKIEKVFNNNCLDNEKNFGDILIIINDWRKE